MKEIKTSLCFFRSGFFLVSEASRPEPHGVGVAGVVLQRREPVLRRRRVGRRSGVAGSAQARISAAGLRVHPSPLGSSVLEPDLKVGQR